MPRDFSQELAPHRAEVTRILRADDQLVGQVWVAQQQGEAPGVTQKRLGINPGQYGIVTKQAAVLLGDSLPDGVTMVEKIGHKVRGWIRDKSPSAGLETVLREIDAEVGRLMRGVGVAIPHPTIEWVKAPVTQLTGQPNGTPIRMRHLPEGCTHFDLDPTDPTQLLGGPMRLATTKEMELPACADCVREAKKLGHLAHGERPEVPAPSVDTHGVPQGPLLAVTDGRASVAVRREQPALRRYLLAARNEAPCAICGITLPASLLIAAHIVPRSALSHGERLKFDSAAFLACLLGCDALFEAGYVVVDVRGVVQRGRKSDRAVEKVVARLEGNAVDGFTPARATQFARHATIHT